MKYSIILWAALSAITLFSCNNHPAQKATPVPVTEVSADVIEAYYFHFTARCVTCRTIESETLKNLQELYPNQIKQGLITFRALNLDEEASKPLAGKLGISGQTLIFVRGDKKINITNEGFLYAVVKPERFREVIREKIDFLMIE